MYFTFSSLGHVCEVVGRTFAPSAEARGFNPRSGELKNWIHTCCFPC